MARLMAHEEYLKSDVWKCKKAPVNPSIKLQVQHNTGAHHWVGIKEGDENATLFYCRYCMSARKFPVTLKEAIDILGKGKMPPLSPTVPTSHPSHYKKKRR